MSYIDPETGLNNIDEILEDARQKWDDEFYDEADEDWDELDIGEDEDE
jgi:hypothetical protein